MASLAKDKNSTPDPVLMALEALLNEQSDSDIRKLLKKKCSLSTGKAQAALREAKKKRKTNAAANDASGEGKSAAGSLRQPSYSVKCGMCDEKIQRGTIGSGKSSTVATPQCDHYFCFECLGNYVKLKITAAEVDEDDMECPHATCTKSMLQGPMGNFTPNYMFTRSGGRGEGILGHAFSFQEACDLNEKFLNHRNREANLFITCPNPNCEIRVYVEEDRQFFRCEQQHHGCGQSFCKLCKRAAHNPIKDCKQARAAEAADAATDGMALQVLAEGGRFCPRCGDLFAAEDVNPDNWPCDHITCTCGYEFCRSCGCDRSLVVDNDNSWHVVKCGLWCHPGTGDVPNSEKPTDWPDIWKEKDPQFNGRGERYFQGAEPGLKAHWKKLGTLQTVLHPTQGYFRKCQPNCGCAYGSGHSKVVTAEQRK